MKVEFSEQALEDLLQLLDRQPKLARKLGKLLQEIRRNPFSGTGKPEPLKYELTGWWSRRISQEHRLVYRIVTDQDGKQICKILQCLTHYG